MCILPSAGENDKLPKFIETGIYSSIHLAFNIYGYLRYCVELQGKHSAFPQIAHRKLGETHKKISDSNTVLRAIMVVGTDTIRL